MLIRPATTIDAEAIAQVHVASWQHAYRDILTPEFLASLSVSRRQTMWTESIATDLTHVLVAEVNGQVVGFSATGPCHDEGSSSTAFKVLAIYLSPPHWSMGIGRELWLALREVMIARGARSVSLWVIANNERAIKFYTAAGFVPEPNSITPFELGGVQIEEVRYVQQLDD